MNTGTAYFLGVYLGDGSAYNKGHTYQIRLVCLDKDIVERWALCVSNVFMCTATVHRDYSKPRFWAVRASSKSAYRFLETTTGFKEGFPVGVMKWNNDSVREFVAGLMDTDGYIAKSKTRVNTPRWQTGFVNTRPWIYQLKSLLQSHGVTCGAVTLKKKYRPEWKEKDCFQLHINLMSFAEKGFYFRCKRKQERLDEYIARMIKWRKLKYGHEWTPRRDKPELVFK